MTIDLVYWGFGVLLLLVIGLVLTVCEFRGLE